MEMKYYNPSNNFRAPIPREPKPYSPPRQPEGEIITPKPAQTVQETEPVQEQEICKREEKPLLSTDDVIILGLILVLISNGCEDYLLLAVLGYLLFAK